MASLGDSGFIGYSKWWPNKRRNSIILLFLGFDALDCFEIGFNGQFILFIAAIKLRGGPALCHIILPILLSNCCTNDTSALTNSFSTHGGTVHLF